MTEARLVESRLHDNQWATAVEEEEEGPSKFSFRACEVLTGFHNSSMMYLIEIMQVALLVL